MTGFDGAGHLAGVPTTRDAIDIAAYGRCVDADYAAAREAGIACVREAIDWRCAERADAYDFATLRIRIAIARQAGVQIAWTLCHSSWPDETSAGGSARAVWMRDFGRELGEALESGIPVIGARLCRVAERPAWEDPRLWRARRLWDALLRSDTSPVVDSAYAQALRDVQARVDPLLAPANRRYLS
jgi:hypothetical protein